MRPKLSAVVSAAVLVGAALSPVSAAGTAPADPFAVEATAKHSFTVRQAADRVSELWKTRATWAGEHAGDIKAIYPGERTVVFLVSGNVEAVHDSIPAAVRPFAEVVHGGVVAAAGSPDADAGGWTAGNFIYNSSKRCTLGFAWKMWATGVVYGSTARHCGPLYMPWYHNDRRLGTAALLGGGNNDVALLSAAPNTSFNASVWVHLSTGGFAERTVVDAAVSQPGETVAYTGLTSLGGFGTVMTNADFDGPGRVWCTANTVRPGDSGGPVFKTHSNGTVQARGTISELTYKDTNQNDQWDSGEPVTGMVFIDATYTSANLQASIYTP
ncbi:hypothetical protein [Kribbella sp. NPDC006257]|uniref:hypothetical protein n=1 Tax=Kribbella sp. NPDC006257 TaxID=3156738 RepID=UPI0033AE1775